MVKTVVVVIGCVGVLLGITPNPSARGQAAPSVAVPPPPTDVQRLPLVRKFTFAGKGVQEPIADAQTATAVTEAAQAPALTDTNREEALANALNALKEAQSKVDCTFALQMKEVDPDADPDIHVPAPRHGDAKIRRIKPLPCPMQVQHTRSGQVRVKPPQKK